MSATHPEATVAALLVALAGCTADETDPAAPIACTAPSRFLEDGRCVAPGVQDDGCPAGSSKAGDACQPAGVPPERCATGFEPASDGCEPVLPGSCSGGSMAVPGETACRPVMPCGAPPWGDLPMRGATEYVDASFAGPTSDGSAAMPWTTIAGAIAAARPGAMIAVAAGQYMESVVIDKPLRIWGLCPAEVRIVATDAPEAVYVQADGSEVGGVAISGPLAVSGALDVTLDRVWITEGSDPGIAVVDTLGPASAWLKGSLVERARSAGVLLAGGELVVDASVVRDTQPSSRQSLGRGVSAQSGAGGGRSSLTVRGSLFERNHTTGLFLLDTDATVEASVIRDTFVQPADQAGGRGISCETGSDLHLEGSLIEGSHEAAIAIVGAHAVIDTTVVRRTIPLPFGILGFGIVASRGALGATVVMRDSVVAEHHEVGVFLSGSEGEVYGSVVRDIAVRASSGELGFGIVAAPDSSTPTASHLTLERAVVRNACSGGVYLAGSSGTVDGTFISSIVPNAAGLLGDGVVVVEGFDPVSLVLRASVVEQSSRAAVSTFGAQASIATTAMRCQAFDIDGEALGESAFDLEDAGFNGCGCPDATGECRAVSAGLQPPPPP